MKIKWETLSKLSTSLAVLWSLSGCDHLLSSQMPRGSVPMVKTYTEAIEGERNKRNYHHQVVNFALKKDVHRLPNPDINLYVYHHHVFSQNNSILIPSYTTLFPLYKNIYYDHS